MPNDPQPTTFSVGDFVEKTTGDYRYAGTVVGVIHKLSGEVRYVVEDSRGLLLILNARQLHPLKQTTPEEPHGK